MTPRKRWLGNITALVGAYGAGQGALFLAQTDLIAHGRIAWLGEFGTAFVFVTLFYQIVDLGGLSLLAREVLDQDRSADQKWMLFWSFSAVRAVLAGAIVVAATGIFLYAGPQFWTSFFLASTAGLLTLAFNPGGMLDGLSLSGWNGIAGALPFFAIATALLPCSDFHDKNLSGVVLGLTYSVGSIAGVALQFLVLRRNFVIGRLHWPKWDEGLLLAREGGVYLLSSMPGQLFFRGQIALSATLFGPASTGLLIYAKQILTAASQVLSFARRSEFPDLVRGLATSRHKIVDAFKSQRFSLVLAFLGVIGVCVFVGLSSSRLPPRFQQAAILTVFFMPALLATAVLGVIMQASIALRQLRFAAEANIVALLGAGLALSFLLAKQWHLYGIAAAECVANMLTASAMVIRISTTVTPK
jgi:hypothetical protein